MPKKSPSKCNTFGCSELTYNGYCDNHKKDRHKEYKRYGYDKKEQSFYSSKEWIALRNYKRTIDPLCQDCLDEGRLTPVAVI